jgi:histidinol phosphatase-like enzyme (inositol monophosphatase family)
VSLTDDLQLALRLAEVADSLTMPRFRASDLQVTAKPDLTPVTEADLAVERALRALLARERPTDLIVGEEEGGTLAVPGRRWIIDPIDGTKSFICGVPLYSTLLSFERDGQPEVGVCYFPALDEILYAERGQGTFVNGRIARVSTKTTIEGSVLCCGGHRHMALTGRIGPFLKLAERALATRTWSDAYGHALVATGRVEAMIDPTVSHWDVSAINLIVQEAGGMSTRIDGGPGLTPIGKDYQALSSNGHLHAELIEAFRA